MSLYRYLEEKFSRCTDPSVGARLTPLLTTRPKCFDMVVYIKNVGDIFYVNTKDEITFLREIPLAYLNRISSFLYNVKPLPYGIFRKEHKVDYERYPTRVYCSATENSYPIVAGTQIKFTLTGQPYVGGVKQKDPHRHIDQTRQKELNQKIKECLLDVPPFLTMAWDMTAPDQFIMPEHLKDSVELMPINDAYEVFIDDPQDNDVLYSIEGPAIWLDSLHRRVNGKLKREYMIRQEIIYYEYQ